jgi:hypothetical protein
LYRARGKSFSGSTIVIPDGSLSHFGQSCGRLAVVTAVGCVCCTSDVQVEEP